MPDAHDLIEVTFAFEDRMILRVGDDTTGDGRTLTGYIVPWDRPAAVMRPMKGWEVYKRGALTKTLTDRRHPIPLLGSHSEGEPVGKLIASGDDEFGQHAVFRLLDTGAARDAAELIREGIWTGLSIGGFGVPARTKVTHGEDGTKTIERSEIRLDHVGLVRTPAFDDARVLALRGAEPDPQPEPIDAAALVAERRARRERLFA